jgi:hypothetical protein
MSVIHRTAFPFAAPRTDLVILYVFGAPSLRGVREKGLFELAPGLIFRTQKQTLCSSLYGIRRSMTGLIPLEVVFYTNRSRFQLSVSRHRESDFVLHPRGKQVDNKPENGSMARQGNRIKILTSLKHPQIAFSRAYEAKKAPTSSLQT